MDMDDYLDRFSDEPGYLDFARIGPIGRAARDEESAMSSLLGRGRFGSLGVLDEQDARVREAVATAIRFRADQVVFQPNTSQGLLQAIFGLEGRVALSVAEFPSLPFATVRAGEARGMLDAMWLQPDHGRLTPGTLRDQLTDDVTAVAVSLVDFRTGHVVDVEGIRQVIGDRLLILDAIQGFGVVDAPWELADVIASGGQKWVRAGAGTGFLAVSDRAVERIRPVLSGFAGSESEELPLDGVTPAAHSARAFQISHPDPVAQARLAVALEQLAAVGLSAVSERVAENVSRLIDLLDEAGLPIVSPRDERERAGIVVVEPGPEALTALGASLHNHGISVTVRSGQVRISPHATTNEETFAMMRAALVSYGTAVAALT